MAENDDEQPSEQVPLDDVVERLSHSAAPYAQHVAADRAGGAFSPFIDPVSIGLYLSVASLLVSLYFGVRSDRLQRRSEAAARTPDFPALLAGLRDGDLPPERVLAELRAWRPDLTAIEVAVLIRDGARDDLAELLGDLGLDPGIAELMISEITHHLEG